MDKNGLGQPAQNLSGLSILIGGKNTFGYTGDGTKAPEFEFITANEQSTGIVKPPKMTIEVENLGIEFITHMASGLPFVLKGNINEDGENKPLVLTVQGQLQKMGQDIKVGDATKRTFEIRVDMYTELVDNIPTIVYTRHPYNLVMGGIPMSSDFSDNV